MNKHGCFSTIFVHSYRKRNSLQRTKKGKVNKDFIIATKGQTNAAAHPQGQGRQPTETKRQRRNDRDKPTEQSTTCQTMHDVPIPHHCEGNVRTRQSNVETGNPKGANNDRAKTTGPNQKGNPTEIKRDKREDGQKENTRYTMIKRGQYEFCSSLRTKLPSLLKVNNQHRDSIKRRGPDLTKKEGADTINVQREPQTRELTHQPLLYFQCQLNLYNNVRPNLSIESSTHRKDGSGYLKILLGMDMMI